MLTQKRLREVLHYEPTTGIFTWTRGHKKGQVAGTKHDDRGFLKVSIDSERHLLHRLAWLWVTGLTPPWSVGHIDGNHANNRWSNLCRGDRIQPEIHRATWSEPTRLEGAFRTRDGFAAMIPAEGITVNLGTFRTVEEASAVAIGAVQRARAKHRASLRP